MDSKLTIMELEVLTAYLPNYSARLHVREISRLIKRSHRSVSIALQSLEKKGVVRHEVAGRNKQYGLSFMNFLTREYVRNAEFFRTAIFMEKHFIVKRMLSEILIKAGSTPFAIFGSYAKSEEREGSDIDILVIKDGHEKRLVEGIRKFFSLHNKEVHIQQATQAKFEAGMRENDNLVVEIMRSHVILNHIEVFVEMFWRYYEGK
ncbi:MAG: nucleotidyltransferase domain-containing protein [Candidatus Aenigmarchaeota archaeon]|nr:nucleotidyltransferase domain-containing protein [Candidatus Aenigmarchaeota archaeon]